MIRAIAGVAWVGSVLAGCAASSPRPGPIGNRAPAALPADLLDHLGDGSATLDPYLDRQRGVIWVDDFEPPVDDAPPRIQRHLCGAELDRALAAVHRDLVWKIQQGGPGCDVATLACSVGGGAEYNTTITLQFARTERGIVLDLVTIVDESISEAAFERERAERQRLIARLRATPCP